MVALVANEFPSLPSADYIGTYFKFGLPYFTTEPTKISQRR